jgi:hypothetical protein
MADLPTHIRGALKSMSGSDAEQLAKTPSIRSSLLDKDYPESWCLCDATYRSWQNH